MRWSNYLIPTLKEAPEGTEAISHNLLLRAGLVRMLTSGVYIYLPLGLRVLNNIKEIIRQELDKVGCQELLLPGLIPLELWKKTGRDEDLAQTLIRFEDRRGRQLTLGPTHEEVITELVRTHVHSYRDLPITLYQIQTKFRDEMRPRFGLIRGCEFVMKDAYSFDRDEKGLQKSYQVMFEVYKKIFNRMRLDFLITEADSGVMGGDISHEFMIPAASGEDIVLTCNKCGFSQTGSQEDEDIKCKKCKGKLEKKQAIEVGHIFQLGTKYSKLQGANYLDKNGKQQTIIMGCYGIGVSRLISAVIEQNYDEQGIKWPFEVAPFKVIIVPVKAEPKLEKLAQSYYQELKENGIEVLLDDRDISTGVKFKDSELIGIPVSVIIGEKNLKDGKIEIKIRSEKEAIKVDKDKVVVHVLKIIKEGK